MNYWIASLAYLRSLDYDSANYGDLIEIPYFEDNSKFSYQMKFIRKEEIDSKIGRFNSIVLSPLIPEKNKLFKVFARKACCITNQFLFQLRTLATTIYYLNSFSF